MKTIVAGSRSVTSLLAIRDAIKASGFTITEVVSGAARGVDRLGEKWARINGVPIKVFPAAWSNADGEFDVQAGFRRNVRMAEYADALVAVWDGESPGTAHMIKTAEHHGLRVFVALVGENGRLIVD